MRVELRVVVTLGLAAACWLALVPTASPVTGESCGIPLFGGPSPGDEFGEELPAECTAANNTRIGQAIGTFVLVVAVLGLREFAQFLRQSREARQDRVPPARQAGWWDAS